MQDSDKLN